MYAKETVRAVSDRATRTADARRLPALLLAAVMAVIAVTFAIPAERALAGSNSTRSDQNGVRYVRMGLNKSIVVRLPVAARDVLIGNPAVVEAVVRTQNTAYLFAKAVGQTNAFFFDNDGRQILSLDIEVSHDTKALMELLRRTIPGTRITADTVGESVVLNGIAANAAEAKLAFDLAAKFAGDDKKVVSSIAITGRDQVMLRVRVAEIQREVLKQFGIDFERIMLEAGKFTLSAATFNPFPLNDGFTQGGLLRGTYASNDVNVNGVIRAMERDGLLRTLAEPTLTAISGESAKFLAGGEFPIITGFTCEAGNTNCTSTVEFKPFGVGLGFTPVVLSEGRISMRVSTEVSELTQENAVSLGTGNIPSLKVRRAETTIELPSGGSMVLAGLIQETTKQQINGTPGLKDLPILGTLFRSRDFQSNQTELVVIVTPFVVSAVSEKQLTTPLDRLNVADDGQTIFFGRLNKVYGVAGDAAKGTVYHGNVGFIVE